MSLGSNNIYNILMVDDEEFYVQEKINKSTEFNLIDEKFDKILGYDKKKYLDLINQLEIYKNPSNLYKFKKFIVEFNDDFSKILSNYKIKESIMYLLEQKNYPLKLKYIDLLENKITRHDYIISILKLPDKDILYMIEKYNNITLDNIILPLDSKTKLSIDLSDKLNLSNEIINFLTNHNVDQIPINFDLLENLIKKISNEFVIIKKIIKNLQLCEYTDINIKNINKYITLKTNININNELFSEYELKEIYDIIIFKLVLENHNFENFDDVLTKIYCGSNILLLEMIYILRSGLLDINLQQLQKIIYYGRFKVFILLLECIPWKILEILSQSNPFDLSGMNIRYKNDLWDGISWNNDENDKLIIGKNDREHKKLIEYIFMIAKEKNFVHIVWSEPIKKYWIGLTISYKNNDNNQSKFYFINYDELLKIFNLTFDFTDKKSIIKHIELFGRKNTWTYIINKYKLDDSILDILVGI
jgi:hypothetical protein